MRTLLVCCSFALIVIAVRAGRTESQDSRPKASPFHDLSMRRIDGKTQKLSDYRGKVALVVNVASECGFTQQYEGLQQLYAKYGERGFTVLAFPSNDFGGQEPGSEEEIFAFCRDTYHVTFPLFGKIGISGPDASPLYRYLQHESPAKATVKWNFHKFLVDGEGNVIASFGSKTPPQDPKLVSAIESALSTGAPASKPAVAPRVELVVVAFDGLKLADGSVFSATDETARRTAALKDGRSYEPPAGIEWRRHRRNPDQRSGLPIEGEFLFRGSGSFTEADFDRASPDLDKIGRRTVVFSIKPGRRDAFESYTSKWINRALAMVVDGEIVSAPFIQSALRDSVEISSPAGFTAEDQRNLLEALNAAK